MWPIRAFVSSVLSSIFSLSVFFVQSLTVLSVFSVLALRFFLTSALREPGKRQATHHLAGGWDPRLRYVPSVPLYVPQSLWISVSIERADLIRLRLELEVAAKPKQPGFFFFQVHLVKKRRLRWETKWFVGKLGRMAEGSRSGSVLHAERSKKIPNTLRERD